MGNPCKEFFPFFGFNIQWIKDSVLDICPNKRVVHLAKHGSKKTCKKNFHRAIRILEER